MGAITNQGQQNNNNNNPNKDPLGTLLSNPNVQQGIGQILSNPNVQQGIGNALGINIPTKRPNQVTTSAPRPTEGRYNFMIF